MVAGAFVFGCFGYVDLFGFGSGGSFVSFGSAWEAFGAFCVVAVSGWVESSGRRCVGFSWRIRLRLRVSISFLRAVFWFVSSLILLQFWHVR